MKNINSLTAERIEAIVRPDFGINVTIHIGCCSEEEVYQHLTELRKQFKKAFKKNEDFPEQRFEDNNCYGVHDAIIVQDVAERDPDLARDQLQYFFGTRLN